VGWVPGGKTVGFGANALLPFFPYIDPKPKLGPPGPLGFDLPCCPGCGRKMGLESHIEVPCPEFPWPPNPLRRAYWCPPCLLPPFPTLCIPLAVRRRKPF